MEHLDNKLKETHAAIHATNKALNDAQNQYDSLNCKAAATESEKCKTLRLKIQEHKDKLAELHQQKDDLHKKRNAAHKKLRNISTHVWKENKLLTKLPSQKLNKL